MTLGVAGRPATDGPPVRDAATVILVRRRAGVAQVLMGQRGASAAFMPSKFVFPGGAVDPEDAALAPLVPVGATTARRLALHSRPEVAGALAVAGIRELWEETGLALARADDAAAAHAAAAPASLRPMLERGLMPDGRGLRFVFRAITPPGRPRRFDARFFLADAAGLHGSDHEDFAAACGELAHLRWLDLRETRALPLPFITEVVLSELEAVLGDASGEDRPVPFFHHGSAGAHISLV